MHKLKKKLFEKFFKYEAYVVRTHEQELDKIMDTNYEMANKVNDYKRYHEVLLDTLSRFDHILGIEKNKEKPPKTFFVACNSDESQIDIYLVSPYNFGPNPYLQSIIVPDLGGRKTVELTDVQPIINSMGNGNILMKYFIEEVRRRDISYVYGSLSWVDKENFERSVPFYKKHGFEVKLNAKGTAGSIKLILQK